MKEFCGQQDKFFLEDGRVKKATQSRGEKSAGGIMR